MLNHIVLMGRFTRDPEIRTTQSGIEVASFSLEVDRDYKGQDGARAVDFIECEAWRNTAGFISKYFKKGSLAVASGRLQVQSYVDKNGDKRRSQKVVVNNIYFGSTKKPETTEATSGVGGNTPGYDAYQYESGNVPNVTESEFSMLEDDDDDLPF